MRPLGAQIAIGIADADPDGCRQREDDGLIALGLEVIDDR